MRFFLISFLFFFVAVLPSCKNEDDNYAGVGKLIADRNKMRYRLAEETGSSNQTTDSVSEDALERITRKKKLSTIVLDEKQIVIVDSSSGKPLGQGVAYVDKEGKIVKIKLAD